MAAARPTGTVTFLFSDIEGSTTRWERNADAMASAVSRHDALLRAAIESHGGYVFKTIGDAFCAAFKTAGSAIETALEVQRAMLQADWTTVGGLSVRIAIHAGVAEERDGDYFGPAVNRVSRLLSLGHGGQTILSEVAANLAKDRLPRLATLRDLGSHRLKDIALPEHVFQLDAPDVHTEFAPLVAPATLPGKFPEPLTSFVGRETELHDIHELIKRSRLVTLIGAGGVGKTRLATRVASEATTAFSAGAGFIDLAPVASAEHVPYAVLSALGMPEDGRPLEQRLSDAVGEATALLVFDNCERLLPASADLIANLLAALPGLHVLATSRETLDVAGEYVYRVQPLCGDAAVTLFLDRARAVNGAFGRDGPSTAAQVQRVCKGLDGIPLALEIAASRANVLSPQQIATRLTDRLTLLVDRRGQVPPHHHTLRQTLDWSFDLLDPAERVVFRRLAMFVDGWTLEAAEAVCPEGEPACGDVLDALSRLVDKSLVVANVSGATTRFSLLQTVQEYAATKLTEAGEDARVRRAHTVYYRDFLERLAPELHGPAQVDTLDAIAADDGNVMRAIEAALDAAALEDAARIAVVAADFWWIRAAWDRARAVLRNVRSRADGTLPKRLDAALMHWSGQFAWLLGDLAEAAQLDRVALETRLAVGQDRDIAESLHATARDAYLAGEFEEARAKAALAVERASTAGDEYQRALALDMLGLIHTVKREFAEADAVLLQSLRLFEGIGDERGIAFVHYHRGYLAESLGDFGTAERRARESLERWRRLRDQHGIILSYQNVANAVGAAGDRIEAIRLHREALGLAHRFGLRKDMIDSLERLASFMVDDDPVESVRLLGAAANLRERLATPVQAPERVWYDRTVGRIRELLDVRAYDQAWNAGRLLSTDRFMAEVLAATASAA